jgi:hypothetical protein
MITLSIIFIVFLIFSSYKTIYEKYYENHFYNLGTIMAGAAILFYLCFLVIYYLP